VHLEGIAPGQVSMGSCRFYERSFKNAELILIEESGVCHRRIGSHNHGIAERVNRRMMRVIFDAQCRFR
jgi:hypothetical protein